MLYSLRENRAIAPRRSIGLGWVPLSLWSQGFVNWLVHNLILYVFCLKTPCLIYTVDSLALNSLPTHASMRIWATRMGHI